MRVKNIEDPIYIKKKKLFHNYQNEKHIFQTSFKLEEKGFKIKEEIKNNDNNNNSILKIDNNYAKKLKPPKELKKNVSFLDQSIIFNVIFF